ncbi:MULTISPECIES: OmpH family outer membrane protein [Aeromonas]|uniref:Chaperone protein Skp n=3 Tax=Gammaproteobacteria TaxID=1236 RepID=A0A3L0VVM9_ECOLX|nr:MULTISPECIES: OmpH family outer membrane protein [Aeromonas]MBP6360829.1 OmpH family outer membrane protein [Aeromonas sp.]ATP08549.1 chaperone protein Skp [Aeromonas salmonicida subsp. pectinolytica 34mel]KTA83070.1 membrane protein [Aeromonas salmonicida]MBP6383279.1 OmpH family outer membrane protein [Aeromonas sp.]MBP8158599.1 OmpH family outer membrane protein [Aeromonas sp.]
MNKALKVAGLSFALMAAGMGSALADTKIAVVDMGEVFQKLPQREAVSKKLKGEFEPRMRELQKLESDGQKLVEKFKKDEAFMSADQKKQNQEKLAKLQMEFNQKRQAFEQDNGRRQSEERNKILTKVQAAIDSIAKSNGYDLVLERNAAPYAASKLDISAQVISQVSKSN